MRERGEEPLENYGCLLKGGAPRCSRRRAEATERTVVSHRPARRPVGAGCSESEKTVTTSLPDARRLKRRSAKGRSLSGARRTSHNLAPRCSAETALSHLTSRLPLRFRTSPRHPLSPSPLLTITTRPTPSQHVHASPCPFDDHQSARGSSRKTMAELPDEGVTEGAWIGREGGMPSRSVRSSESGRGGEGRRATRQSESLALSLPDSSSSSWPCCCVWPPSKARILARSKGRQKSAHR
jgi:hypothetical protein